MLLGPKPGSVKIIIIKGKSVIIDKYLVGFWRLVFFIEYEDRLP